MQRRVFTWLTNPGNAALAAEMKSSTMLFEAARLAAQAGNQTAAVDLLLLRRKIQRHDEGDAREHRWRHRALGSR